MIFVALIILFVLLVAANSATGCISRFLLTITFIGSIGLGFVNPLFFIATLFCLFLMFRSAYIAREGMFVFRKPPGQSGPIVNEELRQLKSHHDPNVEHQNVPNNEKGKPVRRFVRIAAIVIGIPILLLFSFGVYKAATETPAERAADESKAREAEAAADRPHPLSPDRPVVKGDDDTTAALRHPTAAPTSDASAVSYGDVAVQNCIASADQLESEYGRGDFKEIDLCLVGYSQIVPPVEYDVLGISSATTFDKITQLLRCEVSDAQTGAFGAPGETQSRHMQLSCTGSINGSEIWYSPSLTISDQYRKFVVGSAAFEVCGPSRIVPGGESYTALVRKYGRPGSAPVDEARASDYLSQLFHTQVTPDKLFFKIGESRLSVSGVTASHDSGRGFSCDSVLHFEVQDDRLLSDFLGWMSKTDQATQARVKPNF